MYINQTYQDYLEAQNKLDFIIKAIDEYKSTEQYKLACKAERYYNGESDILTKPAKTILEKTMVKTEDDLLISDAKEVAIKNNRVSSNFIERFVIQATQYLMNNGLDLEQSKKQRLGARFDDILQQAMEYAQIHGECALFWNYDHLEVLYTASADERRGMFFLLDEETSALKIGVRFWQIGEKKPMFFTIYGENDITTYKREKYSNFATMTKQTAYATKITKTLIGETKEALNYARFPFTVLKYNKRGTSILTPNIKSKIDLYDIIISDFGDNMERLEGIYWAIKNFGGTSEQARVLIADIERYKIAIGQGEMSAQPQSIEAPFQARAFALSLLEKELYKDTMSLNLSDITGGSLTNVAINIAKMNLDTKANRMEYQIFEALQTIYEIIGYPEWMQDTGNYERQTITNRSEIVRDIYIMRNDVTRKKALELNPYIDNDEIEEILQDMDKEDMGIIDEGQGGQAM